MKKIAPSILSADFMNLESEISEVERFGADLLHVDVMDGHFVPNLTIGPDIVKQIKAKTKLPLDVHLMIEDPLKYIDKFAEAGSSFLTFHVEVKNDIKSVINKIKNHGISAGISLRPQTEVSHLEPFIEEIDMILVMSVNPGFGGQAFMPESILRIKSIKNMCEKHKVSPIIEVDGGVGLSNIKELSDSGANIFVAGNAIFGSDNREKVIKELKQKICYAP